MSIGTLALAASAAWAQPAPAARLRDVFVTANPLGSDLVDIVPPVSVLFGESLVRAQQPTLGEALAGLPGVTSSYYGPNASGPVIRGLEGERIRVLQNGLGLFDASGTSVDHAVAIDPLGARRIEVVRGPATLLYGPSAIGGVVDIVDARIPEERIDGVDGVVDARYASPARERAIAASLDAGHASGLHVHLDGFRRRTDDLRIPGFAWSAALRDLRGEEGPHGTLPNSASESDGGGAGVAWLGERARAGIAWQRFDTDYDTVASEDVTIAMRRDRFDASAEVRDPFRGVRKLSFRAARTDYRHTELEGDEIGTEFRGTGREVRVEATHAPVAGFEGVVGLQAIDNDLSARGEEAFLPDTSSRLASVFVFEELRRGDWRLQLGGRYDHSRVSAADDEAFGEGSTRRFDTFSASAGLAWSFAPTQTFVVSVTASERPPNYQELFADGPHVATGLFEIGDPSFGVERSLGVDVAWRRRGDGWSASAAAFYNRFRDYIALFPTGAIADDLPVFAYRATDARFRGAELEGRVALGRAVGGRWELEGQADWLRATDTSTDEPLPRIAPARFRVALV